MPSSETIVETSSKRLKAQSLPRRILSAGSGSSYIDSYWLSEDLPNIRQVTSHLQVPVHIVEENLLEDRGIRRRQLADGDQFLGNRLQALPARNGRVALFFPTGDNGTCLGGATCSLRRGGAGEAISLPVADFIPDALWGSNDEVAAQWGALKQQADERKDEETRKQRGPLALFGPIGQRIRQVTAVACTESLPESDRWLTAVRSSYYVHYCAVKDTEDGLRVEASVALWYPQRVSHVAWSPLQEGRSALILESGEIHLIDIESSPTPPRFDNPQLPGASARCHLATKQHKLVKSNRWRQELTLGPGLSKDALGTWGDVDFDQIAGGDGGPWVPQEGWWRLEFGEHPQSLLVADRLSIFSVDFRSWRSTSADSSDGCQLTRIARLADINTPRWQRSVHMGMKGTRAASYKYSQHDRLWALGPVNSCHLFAAASENYILLYDLRNTAAPVLQWEHQMEEPPQLLHMLPHGGIPGTAGGAVLAASVCATSLRCFPFTDAAITWSSPPGGPLRGLSLPDDPLHIRKRFASDLGMSLRADGPFMVLDAPMATMEKLGVAADVVEEASALAPPDPELNPAIRDVLIPGNSPAVPLGTARAAFAGLSILPLASSVGQLDPWLEDPQSPFLLLQLTGRGEIVAQEFGVAGGEEGKGSRSPPRALDKELGSGEDVAAGTVPNLPALKWGIQTPLDYKTGWPALPRLLKMRRMTRSRRKLRQWCSVARIATYMQDGLLLWGAPAHQGVQKETHLTRRGDKPMSEAHPMRAGAKALPSMRGRHCRGAGSAVRKDLTAKNGNSAGWQHQSDQLDSKMQICNDSKQSGPLPTQGSGESLLAASEQEAGGRRLQNLEDVEVDSEHPWGGSQRSFGGAGSSELEPVKGDVASCPQAVEWKLEGAARAGLLQAAQRQVASICIGQVPPLSVLEAAANLLREYPPPQMASAPAQPNPSFARHQLSSISEAQAAALRPLERREGDRSRRRRVRMSRSDLPLPFQLEAALSSSSGTDGREIPDPAGRLAETGPAGSQTAGLAAEAAPRGSRYEQLLVQYVDVVREVVSRSVMWATGSEAALQQAASSAGVSSQPVSFCLAEAGDLFVESQAEAKAEHPKAAAAILPATLFMRPPPGKRSKYWPLRPGPTTVGENGERLGWDLVKSTPHLASQGMEDFGLLELHHQQLVQNERGLSPSEGAGLQVFANTVEGGWHCRVSRALTKASMQIILPVPAGKAQDATAGTRGVLETQESAAPWGDPEFSGGVGGGDLPMSVLFTLPDGRQMGAEECRLMSALKDQWEAVQKSQQTLHLEPS